MPEDSLFWADQMAAAVKDRVARDPVLQKIVREKGYICYDEKTPSGKIHIGSGRGWVIHDTVAKAMRHAGMKARFILSSDDMDPMDAIPAGLDRSKFLPFMGMPMKDVPSPAKGYASFAEYYFMDSAEKFPDFGIEVILERTSQHYGNGDFNPYIRLALDNHEKIQKIYQQMYGKGTGKLPFNPICGKCGKIGTTVAYEWDRDREMVKYRCSPDLVDWARGCGHEGEISPYNGNGKLPWKVEWAAKWPTVGVVFETAGKDHFSKGGAREVAIRIASEIFNYPPPYPSSRTEIGKGYEFFTVGGAKMSTSKGIGVGFREISDTLSPKILRYLLVRTRPHAVIDFDPYGTNKLLLLYDSFDRTERIYFGAEKVENKKEELQEKRIYELSHIGKIPRKLPPQIPLAFASMVVQTTNFDIHKAAQKLEQMKSTGKLDGNGRSYAEERLNDAASWVRKFAPEQHRFSLRERGEKQHLEAGLRNALGDLLHVLNSFSEEKELEENIYEIIKRNNVEAREFFRACYTILIGKDHGPKLAQFMLFAGKDRIVKLLKQAIS